jgi:hypothetical protein
VIGKHFCNKHLATPFTSREEINAYRRGRRDERRIAHEGTIKAALATLPRAQESITLTAFALGTRAQFFFNPGANAAAIGTRIIEGLERPPPADAPVRQAGPSGETTPLNHGIARTVAWLNENGFETCDSGDGITHDFACDRPYPYVVVRVDASRLALDADALLGVLRTKIAVDELREDSPEDAVSITATYDPTNQVGLIEIINVSDAKLFPEGGAK